MRRKLLSMTTAVICGIVCACFLENIHLPAAAVCVAVSLFLMKESSHAQKKFFLLLLISFLAGGILLSLERAGAADSVFSMGLEKETRFSGEVVEIEKVKEDQYRIYCSIDGEKLLCRYNRPIDHYEQLLFCRISFSAQTEIPRGASNPRTFDYRFYLKSRGIHYTAAVDSFRVVQKPQHLAGRVKGAIFMKREQLIEGLSMSEEGAAMLKGILFGDTKALEEETYENFRRNGTAHVLAVSGLHVGMLYGVYRALYKKRKSCLLTAGFVMVLLIYGTAAMWTVSVSRAVFLIFLTMGANLLERRYDLPTALAAAALFSVLKNPYVIFGAGFQMSFLAVLSMAFFSPVLGRYVKEGAAAVLSVQLGLLPYMAYTFNLCSFAGLVCNIPVVFLASIIVPFGAGAFFVYLFSGVITPGAGAVLEGLVQMMVRANEFLGAGGKLAFDMVSPPLWFLVLFYGGGFFLASEFFAVYVRRRDWKALGKGIVLTGMAVMMSAVMSASPFDRAQVVFVDVGQGDCIHLKDEGGRQVLLDGGGSIRYNVGEKTLKPYLLKNGISHIDLAAATHLHTDHYLGLCQLAEAYPVSHMLTEGKAGQVIRLGGKEWIEILWPDEKRTCDESDENLNSLIFKVHLAHFTVLVTGDITEEGERMLLAKYRGTGKLKADVLKVAHHGSPYSSSDGFLAEVQPKIAVIGVGKNNYGHPAEKVIEKLRKSGTMVFRTDLDGAVGIIDRRGKLSVCTKNP
ncbi:DNA internalization-related competence protein ComEC/Rec2 [Anaerovoracaceae bacterium 42-11]